MLLVVGGGSFQPAPEGDEESVKVTTVFRTSNLTTPFDYYDTGVSFYANNGVIEYDEDRSPTGFEASLWDAGEPTKLTIPPAYDGKLMRLFGQVIWDSDITTYGELKVFRNSVIEPPVAVSQHTANGFNTGVQLTSDLMLAVSGDYYELCARSGDSGTALYAEEYSLMFSIEVYGV